ncbi:hypothetical protein ACIHCM_35780 [Streptomyces sp. NPDC052023]|uniref:hypothetical protein n=1 Tax=Streptomyces sp. NPDC052023 TaxID=3365681 RepID=UPI0037CD9606
MAAVAEARRADALEIYLPVKSGGEVNLAASFSVSQARLPARSGSGGSSSKTSDPAEVAVQLLAGDSATSSSEVDLSTGEVDGAIAVRRERVAPADSKRGVELASRRVEYLLAVPADPSRWLVAAFSTIGAGSPRDELADAMVEWFDALMTTFRWSWA